MYKLTGLLNAASQHTIPFWDMQCSGAGLSCNHSAHFNLDQDLIIVMIGEGLGMTLDIDLGVIRVGMLLLRSSPSG